MVRSAYVLDYQTIAEFTQVVVLHEETSDEVFFVNVALLQERFGDPKELGFPMEPAPDGAEQKPPLPSLQHDQYPAIFLM